MMNNNVCYLSESCFFASSFRIIRAFFFRPKCLTLRGHVIALTTITWQQKFIVDGGGGSSYHKHHKITKDSVNVLAREDVWLKGKVRDAIKIRQPAMNRDQGYELPLIYSTMNFCCHVIVVKAITWPQSVSHLGLKKNARSIRKLATSGKNQDSER